MVGRTVFPGLNGGSANKQKLGQKLQERGGCWGESDVNKSNRKVGNHLRGKLRKQNRSAAVEKRKPLNRGTRRKEGKPLRKRMKH